MNPEDAAAKSLRDAQEAAQEAQQLAQLAIDMIRTALMKGRWGRNSRIAYYKQALDNFPLINIDSLSRDPDDPATWSDLQSELQDKFLADPDYASQLWEVVGWPSPFPLVLRKELGEIEQTRALREQADPSLAREPVTISSQVSAYAAATQKELCGLAFSGGGIRSATFNLGVLQKLAELNLLSKIDYLSTVSGGGYIGSWLAGLIYQRRPAGEGPNLSRMADIQKMLAMQHSSGHRLSDPNAFGRMPIRFLREYSNYLTPKAGFFSFDTWTMAAVYTRNVLLNLLTLVSVLGFILLLPRFIAMPMMLHRESYTDSLLLACSMALILYSIWATTVNIRRATKPTSSSSPVTYSFFYSTRTIHISCVASLFIGCYLGSLWFWWHRDTVASGRRSWAAAALYVGLLSFIMSRFGGFWTCFRKRMTGNGIQWASATLAIIAIVMSIAGAALFHIYIVALQLLSRLGPQGSWHAVIWAPAMLLAVLVFLGVLQMGLMGVDFPDAGREWLSRYRAVSSIYAFFWLSLLCASIYGPLLLFSIHRWWSAIPAAATWIGATIASLHAGNSAKTGKDSDGAPTSSSVEIIARIGPPVFLVGFLLLLSTLEHLLLSYHFVDFRWNFDKLLTTHWDLLNAGQLRPSFGWGFPALSLLLLVVGAILAWRVDINEFSMHHFYKNRLVRCYLGASNPDRKPNPFTGFDENDDIFLAGLRPSASYAGPYPLINTTLNLSAGDNLAWQERKAASFLLSPCFCGFSLDRDSGHPGTKPKKDDLKFCAYRPTGKYAERGGLHLGTAAAISGAAADPNQGYNTSTAVAFLMTVFDVRLGWWLGNPRKDKASQLSSPRFALVALISELFGLTDDRASFVSLSDGGHFDNMGLYELIRRRCRYIILCDAEQDADYKFDGLGMAIRKCRIDFGAEIDIDPSRIVRKSEKDRSDAHSAVGTIHYIDGSVGTLLYIKSSITGDEPEDVLQYAVSQPTFPHQSTGDQWFSESQFESYRALGYHAAAQSLLPAENWATSTPGVVSEAESENHVRYSSLATLFQELASAWYPLNPALPLYATAHTATLNQMLDTLRSTPGLHRLSRQLFPHEPCSATSEASPTEEFLFCMTLLQLVEDIYFDFKLDGTDWRADPRIGGWNNLIETWKKSEIVQQAWNSSFKTFRADFQRFWSRP